MIVIVGYGPNGSVVVPLYLELDTPDNDACEEPGPVGLTCDLRAGHDGRCTAVDLDRPGNPLRRWGNDGFDWTRHLTAQP